MQITDAPEVPDDSETYPGVPSLPESDTDTTTKIFYTSTTNNVITPYSTTAFGANILSNQLDSTNNLFVIEFDGDITTVGANAFRNRSNLLNVILPNSVTSIGDRAFYYCSNLGGINTGKNLTSIGASSFSTSNLTSIYLGPKLATIGQYAFYGCEALISIYCEAAIPPTGAYGMMEDVAEACKIYVPTGSVDTYKTAKYWSNYADMITAYDF